MSYYSKFPSLIVQSLHPYTQAYIAEMSVKPDNARLLLFDTLIKGLVEKNIWDSLDFFYIAANFSQEASLINLITPGTADLTALGTASFSVDDGWTGGSSGANNLTNGAALNGLSKLSLNSAHIGLYSLASSGASTRLVSSASISAPYITLLRNTSTNLQAFVNSGTAGLSATVGTMNGYLLANRNGSTTQQLYQDGVEIDTGTVASTSVPTGAIYVPGYLNNSNASQFSILHVGSSLDATKVSDLNDLVSDYLVAVGAI